MKSYRILVVDDQRDVRQVLAAGLMTLPARLDIMEVPSAEEALFLATRGSVDLIVTDVRLPGMSGLELVEKIQKRNPELQIILITGMQEDEVRNQVANAKVGAFFFKPVPIGEFLNAVEKLLRLEPNTGQTYTPPEIASAATGQGITQPQLELPPEAEVLPDEDLPGRLARLCRELEIEAAVLLDTNGKMLVQAGQVGKLLEEPALVSALMLSFNSSLEISRQLGITNPENLLSFSGALHSLHIVPVNEKYCLLALTQGPQVGGLAIKTRVLAAARLGLQALLADLENAETQSALEASLDSHEVEAFAALFSQPAQSNDQKTDVDAFWENLAEQDSADVNPSGALSYEQARKLGLTPDEE